MAFGWPSVNEQIEDYMTRDDDGISSKHAKKQMINLVTIVAANKHKPRLNALSGFDAWWVNGYEATFERHFLFSKGESYSFNKRLGYTKQLIVFIQFSMCASGALLVAPLGNISLVILRFVETLKARKIPLSFTQPNRCDSQALE